MMPGMGGSSGCGYLALIASITSLALVSCGSGPGAPLSARDRPPEREPVRIGPDTMLLELGGAHPWLLDELGRKGVDVDLAAPRRAAAAGEPRADAGPEPIPPHTATSPGAPRRVRLLDGDTLSELCARELGSARRWREVAALNGWSEAALSRLPAGTWVELPAR